jgi:hypothetical protein
MHPTTLPQPPISTPAPARPRTPLPFRSPVALPSYHPNPTHDSSAPRRQLDGGVAPAADGRGGDRARPSSPTALSWLVGRPDGGYPAEHQPAASSRALPPWSPRPGRLPWRRSPVRVHQVVSTQRFHRSGMTVQPSSVRPSSVQCVQCPARPASGRPVSSPSGVRPSGVQPAAVRLRPSGRVHLVHLRRRRWDQVEAGGRYHGNGSSPGGLPHLGAARWTAEQARTRATLPRSRWSVGVGSGPSPAGVRAGGRA